MVDQIAVDVLNEDTAVWEDTAGVTVEKVAPAEVKFEETEDPTESVKVEAGAVVKDPGGTEL